MSRMEQITEKLVQDGTITYSERIAILRCLTYSDQIADVSIGNAYRPDVEALLKEN